MTFVFDVTSVSLIQHINIVSCCVGNARACNAPACDMARMRDRSTRPRRRAKLSSADLRTELRALPPPPPPMPPLPLPPLLDIRCHRACQHQIEVDGVAVRLQIWDTAGQERYASMMKTYYRKAKVQRPAMRYPLSAQ
jgi:Ras family